MKRKKMLKYHYKRIYSDIFKGPISGRIRSGFALNRKINRIIFMLCKGYFAVTRGYCLKFVFETIALKYLCPMNMYNNLISNISRRNSRRTKAYSDPCQVSKKERLAKIFNGF